ncbi:PAS domain S-box protein, partial [candidate division KSB1 bacterium]
MNDSYLNPLKENADIVIDEWAKLVKNSSKRYEELTDEEAREKISTHFWALIDIYEHNRYDKLTTFLSELANIRTKMGFNIKETLIAFLNGQSVILNFLDQLLGDELKYCKSCREVTESFNTSQLLYSQVYQELTIESTAQTYKQEILEKDIRLSSLTEGTADAVIILDENLNIRSWNRGAEEMYLYTKKEIIGKHLSKIVPEILIVNSELDKLSKIVFSTGSIKNYQTERVRKDGIIIQVNITSTVLKDDNGTIIGLSSIHRDISEKIRLEREVREQEQLLSSIVDTSVDAIIGLDLNNKIISWNHGAEEIFGYKKNEVIEKNFDILLPNEFIKSRELEFLNEELIKCGSIRNYEGERITKSGKRIYTSLTRSLIKDKKGKVIGSSAILRDITEYKKLKTQMSHSEKLSVVGQLAAGIAHEVGNPLTSISSLIQVLTRNTSNKELSDNLLLIKKQTDRITRLIRELVNFSQPSDFKSKQSDINYLIKEAVSIIQYDKRAQHCSFDIRAAKNLPLLQIPEDQVLQVFINILLNAVDAVPESTGKISIKSEKKNGTISVKISDNGTGISPGIVDKIFDPFFTTKNVGKGTGLGLWVSYGIIESLNG